MIKYIQFIVFYKFMKNLRIQKINSLIQKTVSEIISYEFPEEIKFSTINFVSVNKDLSKVKIYISFVSSNPEKQFSFLNKNIAQIQSEFAKKIKLKNTPRITFLLDDKQPQINRVNKLLDKISQKN